MNIVIDGRMIGRGMHGIARYTYNLIEHLLNIDQMNRYTVLVGEDFQGIPAGADNLKTRSLKSRWISISEQWELTKVLKELKPDLYHTPSFVAPVFNPFPMVMTIHDVNHMAFASNYSMFHAIYYRFIVKPSARKSIKILTVSEFSRKEISKYLSVPEEKIKVIPNGCSGKFRLIEDKEEFRRVRFKYSIPEAFILYIGAYKFHKNVLNLLKSYANLSLEIPLVLSGKGNKELRSLSKRLEIDKRLIFIGDIQEDDLPVLYNCATLFVFPSYYEGFGLPLLEAMACGCPVVVSKVASLPEVCGDAAYYVDPYNVESIAEGIHKVLTDEALRRNLIEKGLERAKLFSWEKSAREHIKVFEEVLSS